MTRTVTIPEADVIENINGWHIYPDAMRFMVGRCEEKNGVIDFIVPQQFESFEIKEALYQRFIAEHPAGFVKEDLWPYVDILRSGADALRPSPYATWNTTTLSWDQPDNIVELTQKDAKLSVNDQAAAKILSKCSQGKQATLTARAVELQSLGQVGCDEWLAIVAVWDWIKLVVGASNTATAAIDLASNVDDVKSAEQVFKDALSLL